jgi:G3E family GTPase
MQKRRRRRRPAAAPPPPPEKAAPGDSDWYIGSCSMEDPGESWQALNARANILFQQQDVVSALQLYDRSVELSSGAEPKLLNNRANALLQLGRFEEALRDCNNALLLLSSAPPGSAEEHELHCQHMVKSLVRKALCLIGLDHDAREARTLLHSALQIDPDNEQVVSLLRSLSAAAASTSAADAVAPALQRLQHLPKRSPLPVTVLSGFLGAGKTTLLRRLLTNRAGLKVAVIVNDMAEVNIDGMDVGGGVGAAALSRTEEHMIELQNGCICCTLRGDLLDAVSKLVAEQRYMHIIIESTGISEPMPVAATFAMRDTAGNCLNDWAAIDAMITVVDSCSVLQNLRSLEALSNRNLQARDDDTRSIAELLVDQIEFSNIIVMNKCDVLSDAADQARCEAALRALNPSAAIMRATHCALPFASIMGVRVFDMAAASKSAGWLRELDGGMHVPESIEYGIGSFCITTALPFHPQRLWDLLSSDHFLPLTLRSKGFVWLAGDVRCNDVMWQWSAAGQCLQFGPGPSWRCCQEGASQPWPQEWHPLHGDRQNRVVVIFCVRRAPSSQLFPPALRS